MSDFVRANALTDWNGIAGGKKKVKTRARSLKYVTSALLAWSWYSNRQQSHRKVNDSCSKQIIGALIKRNLWEMDGSKHKSMKCSFGRVDSCLQVEVLTDNLCSPDPSSLFMLTHKWSRFLRILSNVLVHNFFLASPYLRLLLQKQLLRSQGLFTGNHEYVKPSRCLLLLLLSRVSANSSVWGSPFTRTSHNCSS